MSQINASESHNILAQSENGNILERYQYYIQPGGDEEVTLLDVKLTGIGKHEMPPLILDGRSLATLLINFKASDFAQYEASRLLMNCEISPATMKICMTFECSTFFAARDFMRPELMFIAARFVKQDH